MRNTVLTIIGARPQFIKASVLSRELSRGIYDFDEIIVHSGQHFDDDMSEVFFKELQIPVPRHRIELSDVAGVTSSQRMGEILQGVSEVIASERPNAVLVYGDTDTTVLGAWAAVRNGVPLIHVEAGLRSFDYGMPEEINRIGADHWAKLLCCPTERAVCQLEKEGIVSGVNGKTVALVGDLQAAATLEFADSRIEMGDNDSGSVEVVLTMHRPSNVDDEDVLVSWIHAIGDLLSEKKLKCIFPTHPRTAKQLLRCFGQKWQDFLMGMAIESIPPIGYHAMLKRISSATLLLTDSGGLQKEAYMLGTPTLILRKTTEWIELLESKTAVCVESPQSLGLRYAELHNGLGGLSMPYAPDLFLARGAGERMARLIESWMVQLNS